MALSEQERKLLEQLEASLMAEDPKLADTLSGSAATRVHRRKAALAGLGFMVGVVTLLIGVQIHPAVSIVGFLVMLGAGVIEPVEYTYAWWNWYVGDALGVIVFAPLALCFLDRKSPLWIERRRRFVGPMLLTLGLVGLAFFGVSQWEQQIQKNHLQADGEGVAKALGISMSEIHK